MAYEHVKYLAIPLVLLGAMTVARGDDAFVDRVSRAKELEKTPAGQAYQDRMWPKIQPIMSELMQKCVPDDEHADLRSFVFVATLTPDGKLTALEARPQTEISMCFVRGMENVRFPKPPQIPAKGGMPLVFNMRLHDMQ